MMAARNDGGPAFPMQEPQAIHAFAAAAVEGIVDPADRDKAYLRARAEAIGGLTFLDAAALAALPQCMAILANEGNLTQHGAAASAYSFAAAMLNERKARGVAGA